MRLSISLLGSFQVNLHGTAITQFGYDKVRALLAYIAVHANRPLRREQLETLLWQDQPPSVAHHNLSQALLKLRRALDDPAARSTFLDAHRGVLTFHLTDADALDARTLANLLDTCEQHPHPELSDCAECIARLQRAVELYRGDFLEGLLIGDSAAFEDWVILNREHFRRRVHAALEQLTRHFAARGKYDRAEAFARRQLDLEPYLEETHRALMACLARSGKPSAALAQYENCRRLLARELGVEPTAETRALYERIRAAGETRPHNLPLPLPALIGREAELAYIAERLADPECRLLTLVGEGGIGKTTLALAAAQANLGAFLDGTFFISLVPVFNAGELAGTIAGALALALDGSTDVKTQLFRYLASKSMLLVLDNFEQLVAARDFVSELLGAAPRLKLLVTSRQALELRAEWLVRVQGLAYPDDEMMSAPEQHRAYQAVQLFVARAERVSADLLTPEQARYIARICRLLWGAPLGIELAAGWTNALSCRAIADEIERDLDFVATAAPDVPERHRSLRVVFEHSYRLLSEREQVVLRQLAVFSNPFTRAAARAVTGANVYQLTALVHKSLLRLGSDERYELHPLLKQFLAEKLAPDEQSGAQARHADYFRGLIITFITQAEELGQEVEARHQMRAVLADLGAALLWAADKRDAEFVAPLIKGLWDHYAGGGQYTFAEMLFKRVAALFPPDAPLTIQQRQILARTLITIGACEMRVGAYADANASLEQSLALLRELDDPTLQSFCLLTLAGIASDVGDFERAQALAYQGQQIRHTHVRGADEAFALYQIGNQALEAGALAEAYARYSEGLAIARTLGHVTTLSISIPLGGLGVVACRRGDPPAARRLLQQGLDIARATLQRWQTADCLNDLGRVNIDAGEYETAERMLREASEIYTAIGKRAESALALRNRGWLQEVCMGDDAARADAARGFYLESETILERMGQRARLAVVRADLGRLLANTGDLANAAIYFADARESLSAIRMPYGLILLWTGQGILERARGDLDAARTYFINALELAVANQEIAEGVKTLFELGKLFEAAGQRERAEKCFAFVGAHPATPRHICLALSPFAARLCAPDWKTLLDEVKG